MLLWLLLVVVRIDVASARRSGVLLSRWISGGTKLGLLGLVFIDGWVGRVGGGSVVLVSAVASWIGGLPTGGGLLVVWSLSSKSLK